MGGMTVRQRPSRWEWDRIKVLWNGIAGWTWVSDTIFQGWPSLLHHAGRHPMRPLCPLHERHCRRGRLSPLAFQLAQCFPFRPNWFLFLRDTSQRSGNTTRIPSQGVNKAHNVSFGLAKQTDQADGEILETFRRSARVRDEHAWSVGSSQGKPYILWFVLKFPSFHFII